MKWNRHDFIVLMIVLVCLGAVTWVLYRLLSSLYGFFLFILIVFVYGSGGSL